MHPKRLGPAYQIIAALLLVASAAIIAPHVAGGSPSVDNLASSGGMVMPSTTTYAIYWLPSGDTFEPSGSDSRYESLTQQFLTDVGGTNLYNIVVQYPDGSGNPPDNSSTLGGSYVDTSAYPKAGTEAAPLLDADIRAEVSQVMNTKGWSASPSNLFLVLK